MIKTGVIIEMVSLILKKLSKNLFNNEPITRGIPGL